MNNPTNGHRGPNQSKTILVCDDDEGILEVVQFVLERKEYQVIAVADSREVYQLIDKAKPDMLILDLWMPEIGGEEIAQTVKTNDGTKDIPVIILSAHAQTEKKAKNAGADDYLLKPFDIDALEALVDRYIQPRPQYA